MVKVRGIKFAPVTNQRMLQEGNMDAPVSN